MSLYEYNTNDRLSNLLTYSNNSFACLDYKAYGLWNNTAAEFTKSFCPAENVIQMHQLRFPTPPTTPPKEVKPATYKIQTHELDQEQRTESVIMKVGEAMTINRINFNNNMTASNDFICNWINCERKFESLETLATHVTKVHSIASLADGLYYCRWNGCPRMDRGFNARYKMLVHVRTHTKEKPHQCNLCDKCFSRAENLKIHIRSHSGEKPYICSFEGCQKAYSNSSDRFKHTRTHSMEKPYLCKVPGCQKRYTDPSSLRKHVKTFKHTQQLIKTNINLLPSSTAISTETKLVENYQSDSGSEIFNAQCYIDLKPVQLCTLESNKLNYYYFNRKCHWIRDDQPDDLKFSTQYNTENLTQSILDADTDADELPLDLRTNRIV